MVIDGIERIHSDGYTILYIQEFSDQLKQLLRDDLSRICYGPKDADSGLELYLYRETIKEFWVRYHPKTRETRIGIIGELLAHVLVPKYLEDLTPISILFNTTERSIKKGFDLNFTQQEKLWYGEVKGGEGNKPIDDKNKELLDRAKNDLLGYFRIADTIKSKWDAAANEVAIMFTDKEAHKIKELLSKDYFEQRKKNDSATANAVLISVPFHNIKNQKIDKQTVEDYRRDLMSENKFGDVIVISIQKSTIEAVEKFIEIEAEKYELTAV